MSFGEKLASLRKEKGFSQEELASKLNVSRQAVSKWESNSAYPETEKLILICKLFNISLDELIGLKKEVNKSNKTLNIFNACFDNFVKGIKMFYQMTFTQKIKCLIEMGFYALILLLMYLLLDIILSSIVRSFLDILPYSLSGPFMSIFDGLFSLLYIIFSIFILCKLYKVRYLDYYKEEVRKVEKEEVNEKVHEEKIIIRDSKDNNPFLWLKEFVIIMFKIFISFLLIPFIMSFIFLIALFIFTLAYAHNGLILIYVALGLVSGIVINYLFIEIMIRFIFKMTLKAKRYLVTFVISLITLGIAGGLFVSEIASYKIVREEDVSSLVKVSEITLPMEDNLIINYLDHAEIVFNNENDILIEFYSYDNKINKIFDDKYLYDGFDIHDYYIMPTNYSINDVIEIVLKDIKNKQIVDYDRIVNLKISLSESNYQKLKDNKGMLD